MIKRPIIKSFLFPRIQDLIFIFFLYLVLILGTNLFRDGDPGRHITFGRYILSTLTIPNTDLYSYTTQGIFLPPYEWLAQIIFGASYNLLGLGGVVFIVALVTATALTLTYKEMLRRQNPRLVAVIFTIWIAILTMIHWLARPDIFSLLFFVILASRLARLANGEKIPLWQFPLIMMVWANTHAAFILAFAIWIAYIAGNIWDNLINRQRLINPTVVKLIFTAVLSFAATLINPSGLGLWKFLTGFIGNAYLIEIAGETRSVDFHGVSGWIVSITLALLIIILSHSKQKSPVSDSLLIAGWMMIGLYGVRNIPQFAIVALPLVAAHAKSIIENVSALRRLEQQITTLEAQLRGRIWSIIGCITFLTLIASGVKLDSAKLGYHFNPEEFPVHAVNWLERNPQQGRMFNYFAWGGYLIYRLWPDYQVFLDGQMIYIEPLVRDYEQILHADPGWEKTLDRYRIQWIIVPINERIAQLLPENLEWLTIYKDQTSIIIRRK